MLGDGDRVGAAVVAQGNAALACRVEVGAVITRAQHLDQLELGRFLEELRGDVLLDEADEIGRARQRCLHLRRVVQGFDDLEALGCEVVDHGDGVLGPDHEYAFNH
jgi:hypothetical protein